MIQKRRLRRRGLLVLCVAIGLPAPAPGQSRPLPTDPTLESGQGVTGAFEGWFKNPDGSFSLLLGYFNRNLKEELDIPIGPGNRIEPGGPDQGQPTHFLPRRQWGVFTVTVPKDFGDRKLTWTLTANHQTTVIPTNLNPLWEVSPFKEEGVGNTPPCITFQEGGVCRQGPRGVTATFTTALPNPLSLTTWVTDDAKTVPGRTPIGPPVTLKWSKYRGPGDVRFSNSTPPVQENPNNESTGAFAGKASTTVMFSEPGDYLLHVVANDWSGDGGRGFQCCWTTSQVKVPVKPRGQTDR